MKALSWKIKAVLWIIPLLFTIILLFITCDKEPVKTYYDIKGYGYAFDTIKNKPLIGAKMMVYAGVEGAAGLLGNTNPNVETYTTDSNGYYEIPFIKKYGNLKISWYYIEIHFNVNDSDNFKVLEVKAEDVKYAENNKTNILFDPIIIPK